MDSKVVLFEDEIQKELDEAFQMGKKQAGIWPIYNRYSYVNQRELHDKYAEGWRAGQPTESQLKEMYRAGKKLAYAGHPYKNPYDEFLQYKLHSEFRDGYCYVLNLMKDLREAMSD